VLLHCSNKIELYAVVFIFTLRRGGEAVEIYSLDSIFKYVFVVL
jgi:hypothetical protein